MSTIQLSEDQRLAVADIQRHFGLGNREYILAGLAGTGKTTILREIAQALPGYVRVGAPTGKATQVLNRRLRGSGVAASTIHKLMYRPCGEVEDDDGNVELVFKERDHREFRPDYLIIDEASMVGAKMYREISSRMIPTLWVGDHGQLAPVKSQDPGIMSRPNFTLRQIHRQLSESPILSLAYAVRQGARLSLPVEGIETVAVNSATQIAHHFLDNNLDVVLTADNKVRVALNNKIRELMGRREVVEEGDVLVCLYNNWAYPVTNGELYTVRQVLGRHANFTRAVIESQCGHHVHTVSMPNSQFQELYTQADLAGEHTCLFTYGYALTCHKAQGSQWPHVGVFDYRVRDYARWGYTAVTRAERDVTIFDANNG